MEKGYNYRHIPPTILRNEGPPGQPSSSVSVEGVHKIGPAESF